MEVQKHGFIWEREILTSVYGATDVELNQICYTSKFDLPANLNRIGNYNVSIKTTGTPNSVCMGDALRIYDASDDKENTVHMVVITYKQEDAVKVISSVIEIDLTDKRKELFGEITRLQLEELVKVVKSVPQKRKPTDEEYKHMYSLRNALQPLTSVIRLDIKCNSTQSRLQCSFNRFQDFVEIARKKELVIAETDTNEFRGGILSAKLTSVRRVFKKKQ